MPAPALQFEIGSALPAAAASCRQLLRVDSLPTSGAVIYLNKYEIVRSQDTEFARESLFSVFGADGFDKGRGDFGIRGNYARLTALGLGFCAYDCPVTVTFPEAGFVRQLFSIQGRADYTASSGSIPIGAWTPVISGQSRLQLNFGADYQQLVLRIETCALERTIKALVGDASDKPLELSECEPTSSSMSFLRRRIFQFAEELDTFADRYSPLAMTEIERDIVVRFLLAHEHNFSDLLMREPRRAGRSVVDRVEAFIEANWNRPVDIEEIATVANVGVRTVFREFARAGKGTPAQFAKRVRLQRAAELLRSPEAMTTVMDVALRCGFNNCGRFASDYLALHGELPSETLKRALALR